MHSTLFDVKALVDTNTAGKNTEEICLGVTIRVPIVSKLSEALSTKPKVAILTSEPNEDSLRSIISLIRNRVDIINPTFEFLNKNNAIRDLAKSFKVRLIDLRDFNYERSWTNGSILDIKAKVVFVSGTDCGLGKRTAAFELSEEAKKRGIKAAFAATGQTGIMLGCDNGIIFDAIPTNYCAGAVEKLIVDLDKRGFELIFLEGQASLMHYAFSSSIALLHASNPHAVLLVHDPDREYHAEFDKSPIYKMCDLNREIRIIENLYLPGGNRFKVVGIPTIGNKNIEKLHKQIDLPIADVRQPGGPAYLLRQILQHLKQTYNWFPKVSNSSVEKPNNLIFESIRN